LGKIIDIKNDCAETKSKLFVIQPQLIDASNNNFTSYHTSLHDDCNTDLNKRSQLVTRPNIRLISPPWFFEYQHELSLKGFKQVQFSSMFTTRKQSNIAYYMPETSTDSNSQHYQKQNSIHKILSTTKKQQDTSLPAFMANDQVQMSLYQKHLKQNSPNLVKNDLNKTNVQQQQQQQAFTFSKMPLLSTIFGSQQVKPTANSQFNCQQSDSAVSTSSKQPNSNKEG